MQGDFDYIVGSADSCEIKILKPGISHYHARLMRKGDRLFLEDLNSDAGIYVNGTLIRSNRLKEVTRYDTIRLGLIPLELGPELFLGRKRLSVQSSKLYFKAKEKLNLCDGAFINAEAGTMTAIMGPSGCGKSVFLNLLCGIITPYKGRVLLGDGIINLHENYHSLSQFIGYVPQADILLPELNVKESLDYRLRLIHSDMEKPVRQKLVLKVCERLGFNGLELNTFLEKKIGRPDERGRILSGGQRRRASIAHELITQPLVLFLDEPTSGLSSLDADEIIYMLKTIAIRDGVTIIMTIHQPSRYSFSLFDDLILMGKSGKLLFNGSAEEACKTLSVDPTTEFENPAELLLRHAVTGQQLPNSKPPINDYISSSSRKIIWSPILTEIDTSWINQSLILLQRNLKIICNDKENLFFTLFQIPAISLLIMILFYGLSQFNTDQDHFVRTIFYYYQKHENVNITGSPTMLREAIQDAQNNNEFISEASARQLAAVYFVLSLTAVWFGILGASKEIVSEKFIIEKEARLGISTTALLISKIFSQSIVGCVQIIGVLIPINMVLLGLNINNIILLIYTLCITVICAVSWGLFISGLCKTYRTVQTIVPMIMIPQILFGGLLGNISNGSIDSIISYFTISRWSFELSLLADPFSKKGVLLIGKVPEPHDAIGLLDLTESIIKVVETGVSFIIFGGQRCILPIVIFIISIIVMAILTRLILLYRNGV